MKALLLIAALAGVAQAEPLVIRNARVHTVPGTVLENASVVIDHGTITAVGTTVTVPVNATVIDGTGKVVTAGFIEGLSGLGLVGVDLEASAVDGRFPPTDAVHTDAVHAAYQARDGFDPREAGIVVARTGGGITTVIAAPAGGLIAGQSAAFRIDGSTDPVKAPAAMHGAIGASGAAAVAGSRGKALELLAELLDDARAYGKDKAAYERNAKRRMLADRLDLEALQTVLAGKVPLVVEAQSEADIRALVRLATQQKLRLAIVGGTEAWRMAPDLAKAKITVLLDPTANLPADLAASDVHDDAAALLDRATVPVVLSTLGGSWNARTLRQLAGNAVSHGMPWSHALAAVTTTPAALYGITDRGTLEVGKVGDVVVWSGDPFETSTVVDTVVIGGVVQPMVSHQSRLLDRYRRLPLH